MRPRPAPHPRATHSPDPDLHALVGRRRRRYLVGVTTAAVAMVLIALAGTWLVNGNDGADRLSPGARSLPWPADGQASVEVEGIGSLGTKGEQKPVPIASLTKVMTAYVILKNHPLEGAEPGPDIVVDRQAEVESGSADESSARVEEGQRLTERELLELMLIPSGNNIARLLARWDAGSQDAFVRKMNREASALGMRDTTYTGASGYESTSRSTAVDQLKLARAAMREEVLRAIVGKTDTMDPGTGAVIPNTNTLLGSAGVIGLKTGSSTPAGGALMWAATEQTGTKKRLILGVVLHQHAGTSPEAGLAAALDNSLKLIEGVHTSLSTVRAQGASGPPYRPSEDTSPITT